MFVSAWFRVGVNRRNIIFLNFNLELILCTLYAASHVFVTSLSVNNSYSHRHCSLLSCLSCGVWAFLFASRNTEMEHLLISKISNLEATVS